MKGTKQLRRKIECVRSKKAVLTIPCVSFIIDKDESSVSTGLRLTIRWCNCVIVQTRTVLRMKAGSISNYAGNRG